MSRREENALMMGGSNKTGGSALVEQESQRAIAEVQAAIMLAKKFPRDQQEAVDRIINACQRPTLAEQALYTYARGGTEITGPSIRMAEAIAQQWGNLQFGIRELEQKNGESTVEAFAWDVETNTRQVKVFQVPHIRHTRQGQKKLEDPRDVYELVANQGARRLRACILGIIPGDVVDAAVTEVEQTMKARADNSPEAVKKMLAKFGELGVTKEMIEKRIQRRIDTITPAQIVGLRKIFNSLKDGMSAPADWFEVEEDKPLEEQVGLKKDAAKKEPKKQKEEPPPPEEPAEPAYTEAQQALYNLLAEACGGDETEMGAYLSAMVQAKKTVEDIAAFTDEDANNAAAAIRDDLAFQGKK